MSKAPPGDDMAGWLALHDLTVADCLALLDAHSPPAGSGAKDALLVPALSAMDAWDRVTEAVAAIVPDAAARVRQQANVCFDPPLQRAFTLHDTGENGVPLVACPWTGRARDLLTLAHEFGHATQIMASRPGMALPPVLRETCAFLAEAALVDRIENEPESYRLAPVLRRLWQADTQRFLGFQARSLRKALPLPFAAYDYDWNYPVARALALGLWQSAPDTIPSLFEGRLSVSETLVQIAIKG